MNKPLVLFLALFAISLGLVIHQTRRESEADLWEGCLGKLLTACNLPKNYDQIMEPCPRYLDCSMDPPTRRSAVSTKTAIPGGVKGGKYPYAVLALDDQGRILRVQIKTHYALP